MGPEQCAKRVVDQFDCGADGVIHGVPRGLEPIVKATKRPVPRRALKAVFRIQGASPLKRPAAGLAPCRAALTVSADRSSVRLGPGRLGGAYLGERFPRAPCSGKALPFFTRRLPSALSRLGDFWLHSEPEHGVCAWDPARVLGPRAGREAGHGPSALAASDAWRMGRAGIGTMRPLPTLALLGVSASGYPS